MRDVSLLLVDESSLKAEWRRGREEKIEKRDEDPNATTRGSARRSSLLVNK